MISWVLWFLEWSGYAFTIGLIAAAIVITIYFPTIGRQVSLALLVLAACSWFLRHAYSDGIATERAHWEARLKAETDRRDRELIAVQKEFQSTIDQLETEQTVSRDRLHEIDRLSKANDTKPSLDSGSVRRLRAIQ